MALNMMMLINTVDKSVEYVYKRHIIWLIIVDFDKFPLSERSTLLLSHIIKGRGIYYGISRENI